MKNVTKTDIPFLVRDNMSGAVLNTNIEALEAYKAKKAKLNARMSRIDQLEMDVIQIKADLKLCADNDKEIKDMLAQLLGKFNG
jgi:hypothetical protein